MSCDYRDAVIEQLADDLEAERARRIEAEADRDTYRLLAQLGIHQLHDRHIEVRGLKRANAHLADECRRMRKSQGVAA